MLDASLGATRPTADLLLLSHYHEDHVVSASTAAADIAVHELDLPAVQSWAGYMKHVGLDPGEWESALQSDFHWSPLPHATAFGSDAVFDVGARTRIRVIPLPGHTPGHCGFLVEPDDVLYLADVDLSSFGPFYGDRSSSLKDTRASLARCAAIEARVYLTFHHKGPYTVRSEFLAALADYIAVLDQRADRVIDLLGKGPRSAANLVGHGVIYRPGRRPGFADEMEARMCQLHLDDLVDRGQALKADGDLYELA
ncbi:MBL fold metallo-hydrolase [Rhodococcus sp. 14-2483-1-2]|uniref:MBL fold metallo-hydrolase n=1 Tax=Rhodococcus sp. 14-2483-1-2 TaxID=2023147 RepID=UPI001140480C|nr:MBL fold metallo-hydrolase [Rhodococcus sp. 14-2483-1-2]